MKNILMLGSWRSDFITQQAMALKSVAHVRLEDCSHHFSLIPRKYKPALQGFEIFLKCKMLGFKPDLIHAQVAYPAGVVGLHLKKYFKVPVVVTEHTGPLSLLIPYFSSSAEFFNHYQNYDKVVAVSEFEAHAIKKGAPSLSVDVVGNIVDLEFLDTKMSIPDECRAVFIGRLTREKGVMELLSALTLLDKKVADFFDVVILGNGPLEREVDAVALTLKKVRIKRKSGGGRDLVKAEILNSRFLILPSQVETFSLVAAEALALGRPVVGFNCGGPADFVKEDRGILLDLRSPVELAAKIFEMITDSKWKPTLGAFEKRRQYMSKNFSREAFVKKMSPIYESIGVSR